MLTAAGLIGKVIGAVYRFVLASAVGAEGMGLSQMAYPMYQLLLVVSSAGLPAAISRHVAERLSVDDEPGARRVFVVSFRLLLVLGIVTAVAQVLLSGLLSSAQGNAQAAPSYIALAPALLLVSVLSAYRGYFQGMQRMTPTSVSQVIEQAGKLVFGVFFALLFKPMGIQYAAAGAMLGISLSELCALIMLMGAHAGYRRTHRVQASGEAFSRIAKQLMRTAVPVTIGASIMPLVNMADAAIVVRRLLSLGMDESVSTSMYGVLAGIVNPIVNMPTIVTLSLAMSLLPALSAARASGDGEAVRRNAAAGLKLAVLLGLPAAVGIFLLAEPIVRMIFGGSFTEEQLVLGYGMLRTMAGGVFFLSVVQTTTGILQGMGKPALPIVHLAVGAALKVVINYTLIGIPAINVTGAPVGSLVCYAVAAALNVASVYKQGGMRPDFTNMLFKPALAAAGMGAVVLGLNAALGGALRGSMLVAVTVGAGFLCYLALLLLTGSLTREDCAMLPGGARLARALPRFIR